MHCFHVGYVGIMGNVHYKEILDSLVGWFGVDLSKDDGEALEAPEPAREARRPAPPAAPRPTAEAKAAPAQPLPEETGARTPAVRVVWVRKKC